MVGRSRRRGQPLWRVSRGPGRLRCAEVAAVRSASARGIQTREQRSRPELVRRLAQPSWTAAPRPSRVQPEPAQGHIERRQGLVEDQAQRASGVRRGSRDRLSPATFEAASRRGALRVSSTACPRITDVSSSSGSVASRSGCLPRGRARGERLPIRHEVLVTARGAGLRLASQSSGRERRQAGPNGHRR